MLTPGKAQILASAIAAIGCLALSAPAQAGILGNFVATTPQGYTYVVPAGDTVYATATGAAGGDWTDGTYTEAGGLGGFASGSFGVTPGEQLSLVVAGRGEQGASVPAGSGGCTLAARHGGFPGGGASGLAHTTNTFGGCAVGGGGGGASRVSVF